MKFDPEADQSEAYGALLQSVAAAARDRDLPKLQTLMAEEEEFNAGAKAFHAAVMATRPEAA